MTKPLKVTLLLLAISKALPSMEHMSKWPTCGDGLVFQCISRLEMRIFLFMSLLWKYFFNQFVFSCPWKR